MDATSDRRLCISRSTLLLRARRAFESCELITASSSWGGGGGWCRGWGGRGRKSGEVGR